MERVARCPQEVFKNFEQISTNSVSTSSEVGEGKINVGTEACQVRKGPGSDWRWVQGLARKGSNLLLDRKWTLTPTPGNLSWVGVGS